MENTNSYSKNPYYMEDIAFISLSYLGLDSISVVLHITQTLLSLIRETFFGPHKLIKLFSSWQIKSSKPEVSLIYLHDIPGKT